MNSDTSTLQQRPSGVPGLDRLLNGGFVDGRLYLVLGEPGTGKTTLGMEFLSAGLERDETVLLIHGEESKGGHLTNAAQFDIDLSDAEFLDIGPESEFFSEAQTYDVVDPADIEDDSLIVDIRDTIDELDPDRVLIDPITQFQYLESTEYQFRKRIISFARFLKDRGTTVLATKTPESQFDEQLKSLSDGVVSLAYEQEGRRVSVPKHRGIGQRDGTHGLEIRDDGLHVYPALRPQQHSQSFEPMPLTSGVDGLDELLGGGIEQGTVTIVSGPSGVGKTTTVTEFLQTAATEGDGALAYLFEESLDTFTYRSETFGVPVTELREDGSLSVEAITPSVRSPEEFAQRIRRQVEQQDIDLVVLDGIQGYKTAIKGGEDDVDLRRRLHALSEYLTNVNVSVILIDQRHEVTGLPQPTSANVSYLADNIIYQQFVEIEGELQRVVGVLKKRVGNYETVPRRFSITDDGLSVGDPMTGYHGVVTGLPEQRSVGSHSSPD
ncbi:circadian clock protein KaiC [Natronoarchaeum philippinense]|uniref:non-specific serine/threonine protein kinase n=1 Tax=Natronoarchaeum philippinense TaxID=558529 RepID=A0A285N6N7_NATPI|nr:ATPase domain-containing protein [Natronoarchaeum philippinense]SNZ05132.1 circadian clock protein KaiC [Natronoarchaeum philippinense]